MTETERLSALKDEYLEHYGVKGMKWGILRSKEELGYSNSPKKKKPGMIETFQKNRLKKKKAKLRAKAKAKAAEEAEKIRKATEAAAKKAAEDEKNREKLKTRISDKDVEFVYKNRHLLNDQELNAALKRINTELALKKIINDKPSDFDKLMKTLKKINGTMDDVYSMWDSKSMKAIRRALGEEQRGNNH